MLGRIAAELAALRAALLATESELRGVAQAREQAFCAAPLPAMHLHGSYAASAALRARQDFLQKQIASCEERRVQQVARYEEAYRRREVLLSLRDRAEADWLRAQTKRDEKAADEAFLNKRVRALRNGRGD